MNIQERKERAAKRMSDDPAMKMWAQMYTESLSENELKESVSEEDIINTAFSTLLYFLCGEGKRVLSDDEWVNYLINDINNAISKGLFKPQFEDKQHIKKIQDERLGEDDAEDTELDETDN